MLKTDGPKQPAHTFSPPLPNCTAISNIVESASYHQMPSLFQQDIKRKTTSNCFVGGFID